MCDSQDWPAKVKVEDLPVVEQVPPDLCHIFHHNPESMLFAIAVCSCVCCIYTVFQKKLVHQTHIDNLLNSQRIFVIPSLAHSGKFAIKLSSKISPHPKRVAALPCEI